MFADPQSITINSIAYSLPRTSSGPTSGGFTYPDGLLKISVQHNVAKRMRDQIRLDFMKTAADPLQPATNKPYSSSVYLVVDRPLFGYTNADAKLYVDGFLAYLAASSGAAVTKLLQRES